MAILQGPVSVREGVALSNGTLGDAVHTIHLHGSQLTEPVPVNGGSVGSVVVLDVYYQLISPTRLDQWSRVLFVEDLATGLLEAICIDLWKSEHM